MQIAPASPPPPADDLSTYQHRRFIGLAGVVLPWACYGMARLRPTAPLPPADFLDSVSAYFYTQGAPVFVGTLVALSVFMFFYQGYDNEHRGKDRVAALIAAWTALGVAFLPTRAPAGVECPSWWTPLLGKAHVASATTLFLTFAFYALVLFPKTAPGVKAAGGKLVRNVTYYICGGLILAAMVWAIFAHMNDRPVFAAEATMLTAFGVAWLVKGRLDWAAAAAARNAGKFIVSPIQFTKQLWSNI